MKLITWSYTEIKLTSPHGDYQLYTGWQCGSVYKYYVIHLNCNSVNLPHKIKTLISGWFEHSEKQARSKVSVPSRYCRMDVQQSCESCLCDNKECFSGVVYSNVTVLTPSVLWASLERENVSIQCVKGAIS